MSSISNGEAASSVRTKLNRKLGEIKNVQDYGAVGDGVADDRAAIQAAIDDDAAPFSSSNRGTIYFPPCTGYLIGSPGLTFNQPIEYIRFVGGPAGVSGSFNGFLFNRAATGNTNQGIIVFENLLILNTHTTGSGIQFNATLGPTVRNCAIRAADIGIDGGDAASLTVDACTFSCWATSNQDNSIGVNASNATTIINCDVIGWGKGCSLHNLGNTIIGGRWEINDIGIVLGMDDGAGYNSDGGLVSGVSMESNITGIYIHGGHAITITGCAITHHVAGCDYGIHINNGYNIGIRDTTVAGAQALDVAGIKIAGTVEDLVIENVNATLWDLSTGTIVNSLSLSGSNYTPSYADLPTTPRVGTIVPITDGNSEAIGATVSAGGGTTDMALCRGASAWVRIA
jgi:hypothetical protein